MEDSHRPLRLLSLDGGGIRGLSSLYILRNIMKALEAKVDATTRRPLLPCEYFDLIAGTSTGGLISIMLGTLRMDIDTCINEYIDMAPDIFPVEDMVSRSAIGKLVKVAMGKHRFDPTPLEMAVKRLVQKHLGSKAVAGKDTPFKFEASRDHTMPRCKVYEVCPLIGKAELSRLSSFVCATSEKLGRSFRFRSYESPWNIVDDCPIWQACRATSAAPTFFPPMVIGSSSTAYVDGGLGYNNPIRLLMDEASHIWPQSREVGCIVSIGTGVLASMNIGRTIHPLFESLKGIATDTEKIAREFREEMRHKYGINQRVYFRFNVQHGLEQVGLEEWMKIDLTKVATDEYLSNEWSQVDACAAQLYQPKAPDSSMKSVFMVPFVRDDKFVGRENILDQIEKRLQVERRVSLAGLGGVGKSQIAIEYAYRFHKKNPQIHVFWVYAANHARFDQTYHDIADKLNIPGRDDPKVNRMKLVSDWLNDKSHGHWLMILDNADSRSLFFPTIDANTSYESLTQAYLADFLPLSHIEHGSLLITTRDKKLGMDLADGQDPIDVLPFDFTEAELLLESKILKDHWDAVAARDLLKVLGNIPLAITQAAAYMRQNRVSIEKYLKALDQSESNLVDHLTAELLDPRRQRGAPSSIFLTWKLSFDQISKDEPRAAEILSLMAFLDRQGIPEMLIRNTERLDLKDTNAIGTLQAFSLIEAEGVGGVYSMHPLVQLSTQTWLSLQNSRDRWEGEALKVLSKELPNGDHENWKKCSTLLPHAIAVLKYRPTPNSNLLRANILHNLAWFDWSQGRYKIATTRCEESYSERQRILGLDDPETLDSLGLLATTLSSEGQWKKAEALKVQVIEMRKRVLGAEHPDTLTSMSNLASSYWNQGRLKEAEELEVQVVETRKKILGAEHPDTLIIMSNLALTYWNQGRRKEAEELNLQVLETRKRVLGAEHPDMLTSISSLALTYRNQGRRKEAEELDLQVLETKKRVLGAEHPDTLNSISNLALTYLSQGRWQEAEELEVQVMETKVRVLGAEHRDTLTSMSNLALTYWNQGRLKEAEKLQVKVMETKRRVLGAEHPDTLTIMNNLAHTFYNQGRNQEAIQLMEQVVKTQTATIGANHPNTQISSSNLHDWSRGG